MPQLQKFCSIIGRRNPFQSAALVEVSSSHIYQVKRLQTTQAAESDEHQLEWKRARPLSEMPVISRLSMIFQFLPGGRYHNLSYSNLMKTYNKEHGDIFRIPGMLGGTPLVITYNPDDFDKIYRTEGVWPHRKPFEIFCHHRDKLHGDFFQGVAGLIHTNGEQWSNFRSTVNPILMKPRIIKSYISKLSEVNWEFIERIKEIRDPNTLEVPHNFEDELNRYTLETVVVISLDKQIGLIRGDRDNLEVKELFKALTASFCLFYELEFQPSLWKFFPTPKYRKLIAALDTINDFVKKYVDEAIERLEKSPSDKPESEKGVLEKLLKIDRKIAAVMAMDMIMAGVDTTTSSLTGILLCLAKNPDKQQKLRDELLQVLPQKDTPFTEENMNKLPYLRACIKEGIRIYPLGPGNVRTTGKDLVLSGYRVPKGTDISMITMLAKWDPKFYVEPNKFLPERWLRKNNNTEDGDGIIGTNCSNPFVYLPFGFGPRMCVGKRVVELQSEISVARIIRNFILEFDYPTENAFKSQLINTPAIPLRFKFTDVE